MSADILPFRQARLPERQHSPERRLCLPGDMMITCFNATAGLWCAWPVDTVDDDGVPVMVATRTGHRIAAERVSCEPLSFGLAAADHEDVAFRALRWRTWQAYDDALTAFAAINTAGRR